ncbi:unnamed protein product [Brassicogethes aeneus]|uniref:Uncharacterized protein n=1 Tax=Brassicogethes aeneus TaxID=1431903 RepID=A0A9P0FHE7_BRAAE|nr:unnamed protein product [Brassicogethes aeneus]
MGLLLSVLVACVGFVELLDFFYNVRRNLVPAENPGTLQTFVKDIDTGKGIDVTEVDDDRIPRVRLDRILSHEDIEIEFNKNVLENRSSSNLQKRYLVTEKEEKVRSRTPSPRRFVVTEESNGSLQRSNHQNSIPEFLFQEKQNGNASSTNKRIVLKGQEETGRSSPIPLPLPKQFVVTEEVLTHLQAQKPIPNIEIRDSVCEAISHQANPSIEQKELFINTENNEVRIFETTSAKLDQFLTAERLSPARSRSPSPIPRKYAEAFRRSPSPFPSFELMAPRNSICTELLDNPPVSVMEVDEECYRSKSPSPENYIVEHTNNNTVEYRTNKVKVTTPERSKSPNTTVVSALSVPQGTRSRSKSESDSKDYNFNTGAVKKATSQNQVTIEEDFSKRNSEDVMYDESFLNELDGVKSKHKGRNRKQRRKSTQKNNSLDKPSTSTQQTTTYDNEGKKKEPEPFWVNQKNS